MMEGWKEVRLGGILKKIIGGGTPSKAKPEYWNGDIFWCSVKDMKEDKLRIYSTEDTITELGLNNSSANLIKAGNVITSTRMGLGRAFINGVDLAINQDLKALIPNEQTTVLFLLYLLLTKKGELESLGTGSTVSGIRLETLRNIKVKLPPLPTQRKIASILSAYDDLIENNLQRIKLLEEMAQQTYTEWFLRMKFPGHESVEWDEETGMPKGWEKVKLGDVCNLTMGQSPKSEFYNSEGKGLPFHQGVRDYGERFPANTVWSTKAPRIAEEGDILFSVRAPVGRLNIAFERMILGRGLSSITYKNNWNGFLYYQLKQLFFEDNLMGGGAIFNSVTRNDMLNIDLIEGDENIMQQFNDFVIPIDKAIKNLHIQNQHLKEARDILLPRLMMGMIEV